MKSFLKKILQKAFDPIAFRLGYKKEVFKDTVNTKGFHKEALLTIFFNNLKATGFNPKHIVDVGANHGTWTREALVAFPMAQYTLVEPQFWMKDSISDLLETNSNISFNAVGAGKLSGTSKFTIVDRDDSCSFSYSEKEAKEKGYKQIEVPVITLNQLIKDQHLPVPDIIKIDAEGLDIEVLEGANDFFGKTEVFMVEAGVANTLISNSFLALINLMDKNGYRLFEITDMNRPFVPEVLWLVELVFVKKGGVIDLHKWI